MGLMPKTKEYMIRVFDSAVAKTKVITKKYSMRIALTAFFLACKFEGDHNFDYPLFRKIIDALGIAFFEIQITECKVLKTIDLGAFHKPTIFDFVRSIASELTVKDDNDLDNYYRFMDNIYLYGVMSDHYKYDMSLTCCMFTVVYFSSCSDSDASRQTYSLIASLFGLGSDNIAEIEQAKTFAFKKLKELGTCDHDMETLESKINVAVQISEAVGHYLL